MDQRIVEFIAALRAAGVRVSLAESADAFRATEITGVQERQTWKSALSATLIKEEPDRQVFEKLFPYYFGSGGPPLVNPAEDMSPEDAELFKDALRALLGDNARLEQLVRYIMQGMNPSQAELDDMGRRAGVPLSRQDYQKQWLSRRMLRQLGMDQEFQELAQQLLERLREMGMSDQALQELAARIRANEGILQEQIENYVGQQIARQQAEQNPRAPFESPDLMHRKFQNLSEADIQELRHQVRRLAARLRSRAALRMKKGKRGALDAKKTLRANLRHGGVPLELKHKIHHQKPKLVIICDVSTSVRPVAEFMLRLVYELQDQLAKARPFIFIDDITDIGAAFQQYRPEVAIEMVLQANPPGYYNTNLGYALAHFTQDYLDAIDHRTTVIILGDGRNNYLNPRLDAVDEIKKRARKMLWFNNEDPRLWGSGDSDMLAYLPHFDAVHEVSNLAQLAEAIDRLFDIYA
ncbi:MAG: hypothetical protein B6D41_15045 [Chloroflexi bacterium UTCFX4]|jgi:uncharacterized protein with von Willebrand factor type A (vWA) domain|nr:MAG: hypothetical protein B6D41_15045 [Chloroflexi bacterium UTCFX4]